MCIILEINDPLQVNLNTLFLCDNNNPDGIGIAYWDNETESLKYEKKIGLTDVMYVIDNYATADHPVVVHFRWTSSGSTCDDLIHPFEISKTPTNDLAGEGKDLLFHNGTVSGWLGLLTTQTDLAELPFFDEWSDSRAIAYLVAQKGKNLLNLFDTSRFLIYTAQGEIQRFGYWLDNSGMLSSCYVPTTKKKTKYGKTTYAKEVKALTKLPSNVDMINDEELEQWLMENDPVYGDY